MRDTNKSVGQQKTTRDNICTLVVFLVLLYYILDNISDTIFNNIKSHKFGNGVC